MPTRPIVARRRVAVTVRASAEDAEVAGKGGIRPADAAQILEALNKLNVSLTSLTSQLTAVEQRLEQHTQHTLKRLDSFESELGAVCGCLSELSVAVTLTAQDTGPPYVRRHVLRCSGSVADYLDSVLPAAGAACSADRRALEQRLVRCALQEHVVRGTLRLLLSRIQRGYGDEVCGAFEDDPWPEVLASLSELVKRLGPMQRESARPQEDASDGSDSDSEDVKGDELFELLKGMQELVACFAAAEARPSSSSGGCGSGHGHGSGDAGSSGEAEALLRESSEQNPLLLLLSTAALGYEELGAAQLELDMAGKLDVDWEARVVRVQAAEFKARGDGVNQVALRSRILCGLVAVALLGEARPPQDWTWELTGIVYLSRHFAEGRQRGFHPASRFPVVAQQLVKGVHVLTVVV